MDEDIHGNCLHCGKQIVGGRKRAYCNSICRTRHNSKTQYEKKKSDPVYMKKRSDYFKNWVSTHRLHFNELVKKSQRKRREIAKANRPISVIPTPTVPAPVKVDSKELFKEWFLREKDKFDKTDPNYKENVRLAFKQYQSGVVNAAL